MRRTQTPASGDLFGGLPQQNGGIEPLAEGAAILRSFAAQDAPALLAGLQEVAAVAPFRHMTTPGGYRMSVAMTNCGRAGWVSDEHGYRYDALDPATGAAWPAMPAAFHSLAVGAAAAAGFAGFDPDVCLINRYEPGAKLSLHQDKDEQDFTAPIVSVSLGLPAVFLFGGARRSDRPRRFLLESGDVVVWGGPSRLTYHGVATLAGGEHPLTGPCRINLTFRKAW
jgi:alkylated DNA repair protein (DNA oxidative demethylase)